MVIAPRALPKINPMARIGKLSLSLILILAQSLAWAMPDPALAREETDDRGILISAAASLKGVLGAITPAFEKVNPGIKLTFNYGASGQLRMQIENGAPVDVFISAAAADMDALDRKGLTLKNTRQNVAGNTLVLIRNRSRGPHFQKIEDLLKNNIARVAIGNPITVPAGRYAKEALESGGLYDKLKEKLIFAENVRQVLDYVARGEADAGFVYATDAMNDSKVYTVETIAVNRHQPILYPAAVLSTGKNITGAKQFVAYLRSEEARRAFRKYGFE
jgi:molybdate transport system substrate-binding protein